MTAVIDSISNGVSKPLVELAGLGRTSTRRAADVLAYLVRPIEAINRRLEHRRGSALGLRNITNYIRPDHSSKPAASHPNYTVDCEEPLMRDLIGHAHVVIEASGPRTLEMMESIEMS